ncbi:lipopolysaccharide biosynthesis protein [Serinicoccus hydrothermalis]|uniref:lipopolysaccharide biosynthesis protein n=1 Tax=Serinicoccus hydrothermalis TaxID=1758689 RepID=UPI000AEB3576|nr:lipopolysaccharide biosynthesis protein [Serinicoccus hydrothermalis]
MTAAQGAALIILGRALGVEAVGVYTLALAIVSPIFLFGHLRLQEKVATDPLGKQRWRSYRGAMLVGATLALVLSVIVTVLYPTDGLWKVALPLAVARFAESYVHMIHGYWQGAGDMARVARANVIRAIGLVVGLSGGLALTETVAGATTGAAVVAMLLVPVLEGSGPGPSLDEVSDSTWSLLSHLLPLGAVAVLLSLNQTAVRVLIDRGVGVQELGVFAATAYLVRLGTIVAQSLGQARAPELRAAAANHDFGAVARQGLVSAGHAALLGVVTAGVMLVVGPAVMVLGFGEAFEPSRALIGAIFAAGIPLFASTSLAMATVGMGERGLYLCAVAISLVSTVVLVSFLVPEWGVVGAAWGWAGGESIKTLLLVGIALRRLRSGQDPSRVGG